MPPVSNDLRNQLERAVKNARAAAEPGARKALKALGVHLPKAPDWVADDEGKLGLRRRLRAHGRQLGDRLAADGKAQEIGRLAHEVAYQHWHRMLFARFLAESNLLIEPDSDVAISMAECEELAREQSIDSWALAARFAQEMLPAIFRRDDPSLDVALAPETRQALERELAALPVDVFTSDDALGWTYQFWQADRKEAVNRSGVKIGADELPAVTQLFTEHYMVLFLLHNTVGAWRAGRILSERPELAATAANERELRRAMRIGAAGGYDFDYLRFVREAREDDEPDKPTGAWRPAAGSFDGWPRRAAELRIMDPCCGSGHFLVEAFGLLVRLRMEEEGLALAAAIRAVLAENVFGLEIDPRCSQIAAFNLAMAAWKMAGKPIELPALNIACSGLAPNASKDEWLSLADEAAASGGVPARADLLGRDESLWSARVREDLAALYELFDKAPTLGSLIDIRTIGGKGALLQQQFRELPQLFTAVLARERVSDEQAERAVAAQGMGRAAALLAGQYTLVLTNVPYLGRGKQDDDLKKYLEDHFTAGKADLATAFVQRCLGLCAAGGTAAIVTPQNWLFLTTYRKLREDLLRSAEWNVVARLGTGAFETISGDVVSVALLALSNRTPGDAATLAGVDLPTKPRKTQTSSTDKAEMLAGGAEVQLTGQHEQAKNPDARVSFGVAGHMTLLSVYATNHQGLSTGDNPRFRLRHWEVPSLDGTWVREQTASETTAIFEGRTEILRWERGTGELYRFGRANVEALHNVDRRGQEAWTRLGVAVRQMGDLAVTLYAGEHFDTSVAVLVPRTPQHLPAIWTFCSSPDYARAIRSVDPKLSVTNATLTKVSFDLEHWSRTAEERYPEGLPEPESGDPTQWLFHGWPADSVSSLQTLVARLLGYRWPAELDPEMRLSGRARELVRRCDELLPFADRDGIVCLPSVRGEKPAADRLFSLLTACGIRQDRDLDGWLRTSFFDEHCKLFHHRPFIWHVWDGVDDGFHALVNYHRLAAPNGAGRKTLEALTYSYLGDWIERQRAAQREGEAGADGRLAAALDLQSQLERILAGEPPCDIFVRWKPLQEQPIGWDPDINDGVRLNIRPFLSVELRKGGRKGAGILRVRPGSSLNWKKDRGTEPESLRPRDEYPWFWSCSGDGTVQERTDFRGGSEFDGRRWNDLHYTNAVKRRARERAAQEVTHG